MTLLLDNDELAPLIDAREFVEAEDIAYRAFAGGEGVSTSRIDLQSAPDANGANYQLGVTLGMAGKYAALRIKSDMVFQRLVDGKPRKEKFCVRARHLYGPHPGVRPRQRRARRHPP